MDMQRNVGLVSNWEEGWFSASFDIYAKLKSWRLQIYTKTPSVASQVDLDDLLFILRCEIRNLKRLSLSEEAKEACHQWRNCVIALLECRKTLRETQSIEQQEILRGEYLAYKAQAKELRKKMRALEAQSYAPIRAYLVQLLEIKNQIALTSDATYLSLKAKFYLVLTEAKGILQANSASKVKEGT